MRNTLNIFLLVLIAIVGIGVIVMYFNYNPSENAFFPKCPFYSITTLYCPGCGSQRAIHKFLHGDILEGIKHNMLTLLLVSVIFYDVSIKLINTLFKHNYKNILHRSKITWSILVIVILFWVLRNIDYYPFSILAP